jgi:uncharacterized protein YeaC (DUF1315 family)
MKPEAQQIAIAEACGKWPDGWPHSFMNQSDRLRHVPDYLNDLNAMHQAEMSRVDMEDGGFIVLFREYLHTILGHDGSLAIHATAAQRAEAFLRTIGKWEDDE